MACLIFAGFITNNTGFYVMSGILFMITFFGLIPFKQSRVTLTSAELIIETLGLTNKVLKREDIQLSDIKSIIHKEETYDKHMMFYYIASELLFPSDGNKLLVRLKDGSLKEYRFFGAAQDVREMVRQMPNTKYYGE